MTSPARTTRRRRARLVGNSIVIMWFMSSLACSLGRRRCQYYSAVAAFSTQRTPSTMTSSSLFLLGRSTSTSTRTRPQQPALQRSLFASTVDTDETQKKETPKEESSQKAVQQQQQQQQHETMPKELPVPYNMDEIVSLCKRRGIIFPSSEIYNGYAGFFDYGPIGCELKKNVKDLWWKTFVTQREDVVGVDTSIIHNPLTWKSSGTLFVFVFLFFLRYMIFVCT
jgi:hypothetical protein